MADEPQPSVALYFDADGYSEAHARSGAKSGPAGLMGRQVAGKEFLDAYLTHGTWNSLAAVVRNRQGAEPLVQLCRDHPTAAGKTRRLTIHLESEFLTEYAKAVPPARVLHFPCPPDVRYAWVRQAMNGRFALSGVTHTLSTASATLALCDLVSAPFHPFDTLMCTSRAVVEMVRAVTGEFADYLADRFGGRRPNLPRLELIPLGVNPDRFRPATPMERASERARLGIAEDEIVVLCVGRLSHHAKAHPYPAFHAAAEAARITGKKVVLVFAGWAAHPAIDQAFRDGAGYFAKPARVVFVDGIDPAMRVGVWRAADVFLSLPDNIQETFGLVVIEAMASGLPVVGTDWDGYRDLIEHGSTGYLVPTTMIRGATHGATMRLLFGQSSYDRFLGECSQVVAVDNRAAGDGLAKLVADASMRRTMGEAGRTRVLERFTWAHVVGEYERLWMEQQSAVSAWSPPIRQGVPSIYPAPEVSFAGYPSRWLSDTDRLQSAERAEHSLDPFLSLPLTNLLSERRCSDRAVLLDLLHLAGETRTVRELVDWMGTKGIAGAAARSTLAWLLKYGLLTTDG